MKMPKLKIAFPRRQKKLQASTAAARRPAGTDDYYDEEQKTNLSSAFVVVLILHLVAVGGIYAFNSIKAARTPVSPPAPSAPIIPALIAKNSPPPAVASVTKPQAASLFPPTPVEKAPVKPATPTVVQDPRKAAFLAATRDATPTVAATAKAGAKTYIVVKGDTPTSIANRFGTTPDALLKLNKISDAKKMQLGQTLTLPPKKTK